MNINCDQVAWLLDIFDRYLPKDSFPAVSRQREMKKYGMLYEVMDIAGLQFEDKRAQWNGTPNPARYNAQDSAQELKPRNRPESGGLDKSPETERRTRP